MNPKEGLRVVGKALEYLTAADVFKEFRRKDNEIMEGLINGPWGGKPRLLIRGAWNISHTSHKMLIVLSYRLSGLDLVARGIRKISDKPKTDRPASDN